MKNLFNYFLSILLIAGCFFFYSTSNSNLTHSAYAFSSASPGAKTNSPGDVNACTQCHTGTLNPGSAAPVISAPTLTNGYVPGQTYTINVAITGTSSSRIGFETTIERDANNAKAGTIVVTDATRTTTVNGGNGITHNGASGTTAFSGANAWAFDWTAPAMGTGNVTIYAAMNVTNSNGGTSGDEVYTTTLAVSEAVATSVDEEVLSGDLLTVYPNPAINDLNIKSVEKIKHVTLFNMEGKIISSMNAVDRNLTLDISDLNSGIYFVKVATENETITKKVIKQ